MSARNQHLQWVDPESFAPGLWTLDAAVTMPATAAQQMDNCHPTVNGGLRAALRPSATPPNTGLPTDGTVSGYYVRVDATALGLDRFIWIARPSGLNMYRLRAADNAWTNRKIHAADSVGGNVAESFTDSNGVIYVVWAVSGPVGERGIWTYNLSTHGQQKVMSALTQLVAVQDDRIITAVPTAGAFGNTLRWSASQSATSWPDENTLPINVSRQNTGMRVIFASQPSDLLLGFGDSPWVAVQGDITSPLVRSMSDSQLAGNAQKMVFTDQGMAFLGWDSVYLTQDGAQFQDIGQQINISDFDDGQLVYLVKTLFVPGGFCYDFESASWFKLTELAAYERGWMTTGGAGTAAFALETGGTVTFRDYYPLGDTRQSTYTWKSAPLHGADGREIVIREVQIFATSYDSNATLAVTVAGETNTVTIASASTQHHSFRFLTGRDEFVDVRVIATAGNPANEAPTLEKPPRMGIAPGHLLTP